MSDVAEALDCQRCGACCCNPEENRAEGFRDYVEIGPAEKIARKPQQLQKYAIKNQRGVWHFKLVADAAGVERCAALHGSIGARVSCAIYPLRARGCRLVEAGSERCLQARRELGLSE